MDFTVPDISAFYNQNTDYANLYQGDIIDAVQIDLKDTDKPSPDYWLIITKSCDLVFRDATKKVKNDQFTLLALTSIKQYFNALQGKIPPAQIERLSKRIVVLGLLKFAKATSSILTDSQIDSILKEKTSKFTYLPPDGKVLTEPMIIDYDLITILNGDIAKKMLEGKKLQLSSPFREKVAQRFALHYMSIAIDDEYIKQSTYKKAILDYSKKK